MYFKFEHLWLVFTGNTLRESNFTPMCQTSKLVWIVTHSHTCNQGKSNYDLLLFLTNIKHLKTLVKRQIRKKEKKKFNVPFLFFFFASCSKKMWINPRKLEVIKILISTFYIHHRSIWKYFLLRNRTWSLYNWNIS